MKKPVGWRDESARHSLAARGIRTVSHGIREIMKDKGYDTGYSADGKKINVEIMRELENDFGGKIIDIRYDDTWGYFEVDTKMNKPDKHGDDEHVYQLVMDESEGERIAREYIENDMDDWENFILMYNLDSIMSFIDQDSLAERLGEDPHGTLDIREKLYSELTEDEKEELRDKYGDDVPPVVEYSELKDKIYLDDDDMFEDAKEYYLESLEDDIKEGIYTSYLVRYYFNEDDFIDHAISMDGWEHSVCRYDGIAHYLSNGFVYWRVN